MTHITINDFQFNTNAYFYTRIDDIHKDDIVKMLNDACGSNDDIVKVSLKKDVRVCSKRADGVRYSYVFFKKYSQAPCLMTEASDWMETRIGYLVFLEIGKYVAILKKNTKTFPKMRNKLKGIDYEKLVSLYVDGDTLFEKFSMRNLDSSDYALRSRILESNDLKQNVSAVSAGRFYLQSLRVKNSVTSSKYSVNAAESRVNTFCNQQTIEDVCYWVKNQVDLFEMFEPHATFLNVFAQHVSYYKEKQKLKPASILVSVSKLNELIGADAKFQREGSDVALDEIKEICNKLSNTLVLQEVDEKTYIHNDGDLMIEVHKSQYRLDIKSEQLDAIKIERDDESESLLDMLNAKSDFLVTFDNLEYVYSQGQLFKDTRLISSAPHLLNSVHVIDELDNTFCEKTHNANFINMEGWDEDSIFHAVESQPNLGGQFKHLICDDCKDEWADHIGISESGVSFFVSKHKDSLYSASAFQDIVAQALKNLGNMTPSDEQLTNKADEWKTTHTSESKIQRYRTSTDNINQRVDAAITIWKNGRHMPNFKRRMCLVTDFLSYDVLSDMLKGFANGCKVRYEKSSFQIVWLLSTFVSSCLEMGVEPYIYCRGKKDKLSDKEWKKQYKHN